jgi:hypothetical protein
MSGYVDRLVGRTLGLVPTLRPRPRSRYEPAPSDGAGLAELLRERDAAVWSEEWNASPGTPAGERGTADRTTHTGPVAAHVPASTGSAPTGRRHGGTSGEPAVAAATPPATVSSVLGDGRTGGPDSVPPALVPVPVDGMAPGDATPTAVRAPPKSGRPTDTADPDAPPIVGSPGLPRTRRLTGASLEENGPVRQAIAPPPPGSVPFTGVRPAGSDSSTGDPLQPRLDPRSGRAAGVTSVPRTADRHAVPLADPAAGPAALIGAVLPGGASGPATVVGSVVPGDGSDAADLAPGTEGTGSGVPAAGEPPTPIAHGRWEGAARQVVVGRPRLSGPGADAAGPGDDVGPEPGGPGIRSDVATASVRTAAGVEREPGTAVAGHRDAGARPAAAAATEPPAPTVTVTIGRIEVRPPPTPPPVTADPDPGPRQLSLEAYLEHRNSGFR